MRVRDGMEIFRALVPAPELIAMTADLKVRNGKRYTFKSRKEVLRRLEKKAKRKSGLI